MMQDQELEGMSYEELIRLTLKDFEEVEHAKKRRIIILAKKLEKLGTPKDMISQQITRDLQGRVNSSYVRNCLGEDYKDRKQMREHSTSQSRGSTSADDSKKVLVSVTNDGIQEAATELPPPTKEQSVKEHDLHTQSNNPATVESLQSKIRNLEREKDYFARKLAEKSPEFQELYTEIEELREIESKRIRHNDFSSAASFPGKNELQQKIEGLEKRIGEQDSLLAQNKFEADLELKDQIIPLIIVIDRVRGKAKVMIDAKKVRSTR